MANYTKAEIDAALKVRYVPRRLAHEGYKNHPFFGLLRKDPNAGGKHTIEPVHYSAKQGTGTTIARAQANQNTSGTGIADWVLTTGDLYGVHSMDAKGMASSKGALSYISSRKLSMDEVALNLMSNISTGLFRGGTGVKGSVGSYSAGGGGAGDETITLASVEDVTNFEVGMTLKWSTTDGGALDAGSFAVSAVDRNSGLITGTYTASGGSTPAATNFLYQLGNASAETGATDLPIKGLDAWLPATAPSSTPFFGVDRSVDSRLGGLRFDATNKTVLEGILDAGTVSFREGNRPDLFVCNPVHEADAAKELQAQAKYSPVVASNGVAYFEAMQVRTGAGVIPILSDPSCPIGVGYLLDTRTLYLLSIGPAPHMVQEDGLSILRASTSDEFEVRFRAWPQLVVRNPGRNMRVALATG